MKMKTPPSTLRSFGSDNHAGVHPDILEAICKASEGHAVAYGEDPYTAAALTHFKRHFGPDSEAFLLASGTAANVLGLSAVTRPYQTVLCSDVAHIHTAEAGGSERWIGCKLNPLPSRDGKLALETVAGYLHQKASRRGNPLKVLSLTQPTEFGTIYSLTEVRDLAGLVHSENMVLHMDGARLSNAAAALGCSLKELTTDVGVDLLSFGN